MARFSDLKWNPGQKGFCDWAEVDFPNGWRVTFLRGNGRNASIHMDPTSHAYIGPYEICPWGPDGKPCPEELEGDWPKHGSGADMQRFMGIIERQKVTA